MRTLLGLVAGATLVLGACGGDDGMSRGESISQLEEAGFSTAEAECITDATVDEFGDLSVVEDPNDEEAERLGELILDCSGLGDDTAAGDDGATGDDTTAGDDSAAGDDTAVGEDSAAGDDTAAGDDGATGDDTAAGEDSAAGDDTAAGDDSAVGDDTTAGDGSVSGPLTPDSPAPGTDPTFDALWEACAAEDPDACDILFLTSDVGSAYEEFGLSCGGRQVADCHELLGDANGSLTPDTPAPGTDAALDALWDGCAGGDAQACDDLFLQSPVDSDYEHYGRLCGGRGFGDCAGRIADYTG